MWFRRKRLRFPHGIPRVPARVAFDLYTERDRQELIKLLKDLGPEWFE